MFTTRRRCLHRVAAPNRTPPRPRLSRPPLRILPRYVSGGTAAAEIQGPDPAAVIDAPPPTKRPITAPSRLDRIKSAKPFSDFLTDSLAREHTYLRISLTERCNLRCLYCMPAEGIPLSPAAHLLSTPEILELSHLFVSEGVNKIRLTGGEPTVRKDILELIQELGKLRPLGLHEIAMTSNGVVLGSGKRLERMAEAGLNTLNLSLDTLVPAKFEFMTRRKGLSAVLKTIEHARAMGFGTKGSGRKIKINCVVMKNVNDDEILDFVEMARDMPIEVRFIEYMPFDGNKWNENKMVSYQTMLDIIRAKYPSFAPLSVQRPNDTSKTYSIPGFAGTVGFITSMTHNFCGSCNRLRITSDGNIKVCLFDEKEVSLRDLLREFRERDDKFGAVLPGQDRAAMEQRLLEVIGVAVKGKKSAHAGIPWKELKDGRNRPMILIDRALSRSAASSAPRIPFHLLPHSVSSVSQARFFSTNIRKHYADGSVEKPPEEREDMQPDTRPPLAAPLPPIPPTHVPQKSADEELPDEPIKPTIRFPKATFSTPRIHFPYQNRRAGGGPRGTAEEETSSRLSSQVSSGETSGERSGDASGPTEGLPWAELTRPAMRTQSAGEREDGSPEDSESRRPRKAPAPRLTHLTNSGAAHMVPIHYKISTIRHAIAHAFVTFGSEEPINLIRKGLSKKGDVLSIVRIAGIMAAKKTADIIPLCHPAVSLSSAEIRLQLLDDKQALLIQSRVTAMGKTGVEMEALTAVMGSALTVVDMVKSVDKNVRITWAGIMEKRGGKSGQWVRGEGEENGAKGSGVVPLDENDEVDESDEEDIYPSNPNRPPQPRLVRSRSQDEEIMSAAAAEHLAAQMSLEESDSQDISRDLKREWRNMDSLAKYRNIKTVLRRYDHREIIMPRHVADELGRMMAKEEEAAMKIARELTMERKELDRRDKQARLERAALWSKEEKEEYEVDLEDALGIKVAPKPLKSREVARRRVDGFGVDAAVNGGVDGGVDNKGNGGGNGKDEDKAEDGQQHEKRGSWDRAYFEELDAEQRKRGYAEEEASEAEQQMDLTMAEELAMAYPQAAEKKGRS